MGRLQVSDGLGRQRLDALPGGVEAVQAVQNGHYDLVLMDAPEKRLSIETVQKFVADHYKVKIADLKARNNSRSVTIPRQVAMYLAKHLTAASLPEIGRGFPRVAVGRAGGTAKGDLLGLRDRKSVV